MSQDGMSLRNRREALGLSLRQAADATGLDRASITAVEQGTREVRSTTIGVYAATLDRLETERTCTAHAAPTIQAVVEYPSGAKVMFSGPVEEVAEAVRAVVPDNQRGRTE